MESILYILGLLGASLLIGLVIPVLSWKGIPARFTRFNWLGVAVGAFAVAVALFVGSIAIEGRLRQTADERKPQYQHIAQSTANQWFGMKYGEYGWKAITADEATKAIAQKVDYERAERRVERWPPAVGFLSGLFAAASVGSLLAVFFLRTGSTANPESKP